MRISARHWTDWVGFFFFLALAVRVGFTFGKHLGTIPVVLCPVLTALTYLFRKPVSLPQKTRPLAFVAAYVCTFLMPVFFVAAASFRPGWIVPQDNDLVISMGLLVWFLCLALTGGVLIYMRQAFSIVPQARTLIVRGPYGFVRHPLYAIYLAQYTAIALCVPTLAVMVACAVWLTAMLTRVRYEEEILLNAFPEYSEYRREVGMFFPRINLAFRRRRPAEV